jgi:hypothetical protein
MMADGYAALVCHLPSIFDSGTTLGVKKKLTAFESFV